MLSRRALVPGTLALLLTAGGTPVLAAETITIGVQLPQSGERAAVGRTIRNAVEMGMEDVNRTGGINGAALVAVWEDTRDSAEGAVAAIRGLIAQPRVVAVVGELFSPFAMASRDAVEQAGIPYLVGGTSPRTTAGAQWIFRVGASDALLGDLLARYTAETLYVVRIRGGMPSLDTVLDERP